MTSMSLDSHTDILSPVRPVEKRLSRLSLNPAECDAWAREAIDLQNEKLTQPPSPSLTVKLMHDTPEKREVSRVMKSKPSEFPVPAPPKQYVEEEESAAATWNESPPPPPPKKYQTPVGFSAQAARHEMFGRAPRPHFKHHMPSGANDDTNASSGSVLNWSRQVSVARKEEESSSGSPVARLKPRQERSRPPRVSIGRGLSSRRGIEEERVGNASALSSEMEMEMEMEMERPSRMRRQPPPPPRRDENVRGKETKMKRNQNADRGSNSSRITSRPYSEKIMNTQLFHDVREYVREQDVQYSRSMTESMQLVASQLDADAQRDTEIYKTQLETRKELMTMFFTTSEQMDAKYNARSEQRRQELQRCHQERADAQKQYILSRPYDGVIDTACRALEGRGKEFWGTPPVCPDFGNAIGKDEIDDDGDEHMIGRPPSR